MSKKRTRIRWGRVALVGGLLLLVLIVPLFSWLLRSGLDRQLLTQALSEASGTEVSFESYSLSFGGEAHLKELTVRLGEEELLRAEGLDASFSWWSLLIREPEVRSVTLQAPRLSLSPSLVRRLSQRPIRGSVSLAVEFHDAAVKYTTANGPIVLDALSGTLSAGELSFQGPAELSGKLNWSANPLNYEFNNLPLELLSRLSGKSLPGGTVTFKGTRNGQELSGLTSIQSTTLAGTFQYALSTEKNLLEGRLETEGMIVLGHHIEAAVIPFEATDSLLTLKQATVTAAGQQPVSLEGTVSKDEVQVTLERQDLSVRLSGDSSRLSLQASLDETAILDAILTTDPWTLQIGNLNGGYLLRRNNFDGVGFDFTGRVTWDKKLAGEIRSEGGRIEEYFVQGTTVKLASVNGSVRVIGQSMLQDNPLTFQADLQDQTWDITASADSLPASLIKQNLAGLLKLQVSAVLPNGTPQFEFAYSGSNQLPPLSGKGELRDSVLSFETLELPQTTPILQATGRLNLADDTVHLQTEFKGQQLAGLWPESPIKGQLFGRATVGGTTSEPRPTFEGELKEVTWRDIYVGRVAINFQEDELTARLADLSLADVPQLKPYLSGLGSLELKGAPNAFMGSASFPKVKYQGRELGALEAGFEFRGEELEITSVSLPFATAQGVLNSTSIDLNGRLKKFDLKLLSDQAQGSVDGTFTVRGAVDKPRASFRGSVEKLVYRGQTIGDVPIEASFDGSKVRAQIKGLSVETLSPLSEALPALHGRLDVGIVAGEESLLEATLSEGRYGEVALPPISTALSCSADLVKVQHLTLHQEKPVSLSGTFSPQEGTYQLSSRMEQVNVAPLLALLPQRPPLRGSLTGHLSAQGSRATAQLKFEGSASRLSVDGVGVGDIPKLSFGAGSEGEFELKAEQISAAGIMPLQNLYPNLRGTAAFEAVRADSKAPIALSGHLSESNLPALSFSGDWDGRTFRLASLKGDLQPPVELSGTVRDGQIQIGGALQGQSLHQLMALGGSQPSEEVAANLAGDFKLSGHLSNPTASLNGPVTNLRYRHSQLGSGRLHLTINQNLSGELQLDQPYDATLADAAPGSVVQVPAINDILKGALKARISAVKISGTPSNPKVTPVVTAVGVAPKIQLPTQVQLPDLPAQLPDVLQQSGVKIPVLQPGGPSIRLEWPPYSTKHHTIGLFSFLER